MHGKTFNLLLASRSPRRREILKEANFSYTASSSNSSESFDENLTLDENLKAVAETKVMVVASKLSSSKLKGKVILGADTVVAIGKTVLGKPKNVADAARMMGLLSGKMHCVKTGFCLYCPDEKKIIRRVITTKVGFRKLSKADIKWYVNSKEPFGKAGGYGIQGLAQNFVNYLSGDFLNVVGLPSMQFEKNLESIDGMSPNQSAINVQEKIRAAEKRSGRGPGSVTLLAASKTRSAEALLQIINSGVTHFGENYVQEASKKIEKVKVLDPDKKIYWHLIGALQTNKTKAAVGRFETIQSVDRIELARALDARAKEANLIQNILIQIKLGDEPTKGGVSVSETPELIEKILDLKNIRLEGVMSLPPIEAEAEGSRKYFSQLRELRLKWSALVSHESGSFSQLSMGTTHDFEVAIEEGATMVRIGTAIFGSREISGLQ